MATRFVLSPDPDGRYSIIDIFTGQSARYAGRELTAIPADMASTGLRILNDLDEAERASWDYTTKLVGSRSAPA